MGRNDANIPFHKAKWWNLKTQLTLYVFIHKLEQKTVAIILIYII